MRKDTLHLNPFRNRTHPLYKSDDSFGATGFFVIPIDPKSDRYVAIIISSTGDAEKMPWEHVSVRIGEKHNGKLKERIPTWEEMCLIKELFWDEDEAVMQIHPPVAEYVNQHPCVLHLWRPLDGKFPRPPVAAV